ncbi:unnamed protein product [Rhizoctonia solani]|uniref:Peptidase C14 caspase domain-containing protein n=3 Tax=Rhizoctonia solani TaxID=456999 RepID=A0A8H3CSZ5_9AGAM|nr:ICE-like protease (caspase) p20 domain protein [Rhizoctonia solani AG-3 Rhs1AP]KEP52523.1 ICE-like protease (caspase) p20 domain protein [Rhizoctonia solani 123E]CAE6382421.1 unnamed protein product [Rhizoctonia solani]CAE6497551.1 unnamed protein product [Rhizoctonia solani]
MSYKGVEVPKIRGLVIGIDTYQRSDLHPYLGGRNVSNATSILRVFMDMGTPRDNFLCLHNEKATRQAILEGFDTHLVNNSEIKMGDPIVIYLAGYGNRTTSPFDVQSTNKEKEMILPHDINTFDIHGNYILGIPDVKLLDLLHRLRQRKGTNIALITECCHIQASARGARSTRVRSSHDPTELGFKEMMKDQVYSLFSDETPPASPIHPAPWREELFNDIALSANPLPLASSNLTKPLEDLVISHDETPDRPIPSSAEHALGSPSQGIHVLPDPVEPDKLSPSLFQGVGHENSLKSSNWGPLKSRIHGLIIGIDKYASLIRQDLRGCVNDAKSMRMYFTGLGVAENRFLCLYDEHATRKAILDGFSNHLFNNPDIKPHDPIVIYFAGHGDRMPAPQGWPTADGMIEMIIPHDASEFDENGSYTHGIPDLTLAFLLYRLSQLKGNNITVILDCCHSGSGTRGEVRSRNSHDSNAPPIPNELDARLRGSLAVNYPSLVEKHTSGKLMAPSLETHILLAACQNDELAQEVSINDQGSDQMSCSGVFTSILLSELRKCDLETTSYTTLLRNLLMARSEYYQKSHERIASQTFQCEGRNQDRILFSVQYAASKGKIALIPTKDKSVYRVRVGIAQGVGPGTEFGVFSDNMDPMAPPIAILVARDVSSIDSHLHGIEPNTPQEIPRNAYATIIRYNDHSNGVQIWVDDAVKQDVLWESVLTSLNSLPICWATSPENHDLALLPSNGGVELQGSHMTPGQIETSHIIEHGKEVQQLVAILTAIVYFYFHLKIQNKNAPVRDQLSMMLRELNEKEHSWGSIIYEPKGYDLFGDRVSAGTVTILHPNPDKVFGLELVNNSSENFYPYVLYYDFKDYSVGCLYEPPSRSAKAPLQAGKSLTIGYGSGGSKPFQIDFTDPTSDKECGAFLLLVFGSWVDIAYLQQESPFGEGVLSPSRGAYSQRYLNSQMWDSLIVRVQLLAKAKEA